MRRKIALRGMIIFGGFSGVGALCLIAFRSIGTSVGDSGFLHEPFWLLPIGFVLLSIGIIGVIIFVLRWKPN